jgi:hypothetical protein
MMSSRRAGGSVTLPRASPPVDYNRMGKRTRAAVAAGSDRATEPWTDALKTQTPGRRTMVEMEARRWRPIEDAPATPLDEPAADTGRVD